MSNKITNVPEKKNESLPMSQEDMNEIYKKLCGTTSEEICENTLQLASKAFPKTVSKERALSVTCEMLKEMSPKDPTEAMLCSQIIGLNAQGMKYLARAEGEENWLCHTEAAVNMAIKLLRLKNETIETLMRYRRKGEQKVVVQHINVTDEARAIIGDVSDNRGGGNDKS